MTSIIIADAFPTIRLAVRHILESSGFKVIADACSGVEAIELVQKHAPEILIIGLGLPRLDGLEVLWRLSKKGAPTKSIILTEKSSFCFGWRCIRAGASGFIQKSSSLNIIIAAVKAVHAGYKYFPAYAEELPSPQKFSKFKNINLNKLTDHEIMILISLARGKAGTEIASDMMLSEKTISSHKCNLMKKLGAKNLPDLVSIASLNSLI